MQHFKQSHSKCGMICSLKGKVSKADETGKGKKSDVIKDSGWIIVLKLFYFVVPSNIIRPQWGGSDSSDGSHFALSHNL